MRIAVGINSQRVRADGRCAVRMRVAKDGERAFYAFPFACEPARWDARLCRFKPGGNAVAYNRTIAATVQRAEELALEPRITAKGIVQRLKVQGAGLRPLVHEAIMSTVERHTQRFGSVL